jgi:hypothetical protein
VPHRLRSHGLQQNGLEIPQHLQGHAIQWHGIQHALEVLAIARPLGSYVFIRRLFDKRKRGYGKTVTPWSIVVGNERFERSAFGSGGQRSIQLS